MAKTTKAVQHTPAAETQDTPNAHPTVSIGGTAYALDFSLPRLCEAEQAFLRQGHYVNLLFALDVTTLNLSRLRDLFAAAVRTHHPDLGYEGAIALVQTENFYDIANAAFAALKGKAGA